MISVFINFSSFSIFSGYSIIFWPFTNNVGDLWMPREAPYFQVSFARSSIWLSDSFYEKISIIFSELNSLGGTPYWLKKVPILLDTISDHVCENFCWLLLRSSIIGVRSVKQMSMYFSTILFLTYGNFSPSSIKKGISETTSNEKE